MARGQRFEYTPPSYEDLVETADRKGSLYAQMFKDVKVWTPKQGANLIRILPPTWEGSRGKYGLTVKMHYNVGPNDERYLCLRDQHSPYNRCPVDQALYDLGPQASREEKFALRAADGVVYYIVDRDNEGDGVQVWLTSGSNHAEIASQSINRRNKSVLPITDPFDGYDVEFTRTGTGKKGTKYRGFQVARETSPLSDSDRRMDDWLAFITEHPLPTVLNFYSPEHLEQAFYGQAREEALESRRTRRPRDRDDDEDDTAGEERSRRRAPARGEDDSDSRSPLRRTRDDADDAGDRVSRSRENSDERPGRAVRDREDSRDDDRDARPSARASRGRDPDDVDRTERVDANREGRPSRSSRDDDDGSRDDRPSRAGRGRDPDDADEPRERTRSRLSRELDDEIPSDAGRRGRPNGRDDADDSERDGPATRRSRDADDRADAGDHESRRSAMRERISSRSQ